MPLPPSIVGRLDHQHELISTFIKEIPEAQLRHRPNPEKWSMFENIVHLAAYQPSFIRRIDAMLGDEKPRFSPYRAEEDATFFAYLEKPVRNIEDEIYEKRRTIAQLLRTASDQQLGNWGEHAKYGRLTLVNWTEFFLLHEAHHQFTCFMLSRVLTSAEAK